MPNKKFWMRDSRERDIQALISMVDEPDPAVFSEIAEKIVGYGQTAFPILDEAIHSTADEELLKRLEEISQRILFKQLSAGLEHWKNSEEQDLLTAWLHVSRYSYPDINESEVHNGIEAIRKDVWLEMNENLTALEQIKVFNHVFYDLHRFSGNIDDYHNPDNSFVHKVLQSRSGNPLSIGVIYMLVARSVDIPISGINLPEHFVLAYMGDRLDADKMMAEHENALFYINAFSGGAVFSTQEINEFLLKLGMEPLAAFFNPCSNRDIIIRMLNNLIIAYEQVDRKNRVSGFKNLRDNLQNP